MLLVPYQQQALLFCAEDVGVDPKDVVEPAFSVFVNARSRPDLFDGVSETLSTLKEQGYLLGAITNGNADFSKIESLNTVMDFCISAGLMPNVFSTHVFPYNLSSLLI
jgi:putative hydrolase of the HAD superfamily